MLWKQAPPIRLGQQANKRGQDQHDEGFRHCLLHRRNTIMSVACFDRVVGEQAGPEREGLAVQGRSNRNDPQNPQTVSHWKTTFATFTWSWCSRTFTWSWCSRCLLIGSSWQCSGWRCFDPEKNISSCYQRYLRARESDSYHSIYSW